MKEIIEKARKWYRDALKMWLFPRRLIYEPSMVIEFQHCKREDYPCCGGMSMEAHLTMVDIEERPEDAEAEFPLSIFSDPLTEEEKSKRFFAFVSAHT